MVVVLPAPLGPRKPTISPRSTWKLMWSTASTGPKYFVRFVDFDHAAASHATNS